jgi:hypothetical protein
MWSGGALVSGGGAGGWCLSPWAGHQKLKISWAAMASAGGVGGVKETRLRVTRRLTPWGSMRSTYSPLRAPEGEFQPLTPSTSTGTLSRGTSTLWEVSPGGS